MATRLLMERAGDLRGLGTIKAAGLRFPYTPQQLTHAYIKLDFKHQFENARTAEDAKGFFRSISRAAMAAHDLAEMHGGVLLEVQGSILHVGLSRPFGITESVVVDRLNAFVADLHRAYRLVFNDPNSRVEGWRMAADGGNTLVVVGRGIHGDDSRVSLGSAANRPAKYLYAQLELSEDDRDLKRFHVGIREPRTGQWIHKNLDQLPARLDEIDGIVKSARQVEPTLDFVEAASGWKKATAQALSVGSPGSTASPSADKPQTYFGWVMRTDLDGFTSRVDACLDDDQELEMLAEQFYCIMGAAAEFANQHGETLAQLPWAGDNFTAAAVFSTKEEYDEAMPTRLVELSLDFEKEMADAATDGGFGGWAHGVAGGAVHGNSGGNVYLAGIEIARRRFLVGVGEGFGRSTQAFGDIDPKAAEIVVYKPDWERLDGRYKDTFDLAVNRHGEHSALYRVAGTNALLRVRARQEAIGAATTITFPSRESREVAARPYFR